MNAALVPNGKGSNVNSCDFFKLQEWQYRRPCLQLLEICPAFTEMVQWFWYLQPLDSVVSVSAASMSTLKTLLQGLIKYICEQVSLFGQEHSQSVSQSVRWSVSQLVSQVVSQSVSQSVNQLVNQSVSQLVSQHWMLSTDQWHQKCLFIKYFSQHFV